MNVAQGTTADVQKANEGHNAPTEDHSNH
jgi:hypothetical protein